MSLRSIHDPTAKAANETEAEKEQRRLWKNYIAPKVKWPMLMAFAVADDMFCTYGVR